LLVWQSERYWMPTDADIAELEAGIVDAAEGAWMTEHDPGAIDWLATDGHIRQYAGFVDEEGEHKVHVAGDCSPVNDQWTSTVVLVTDGGPCCFYGTFNADRSEWESFEFHGPA